VERTAGNWIQWKRRKKRRERERERERENLRPRVSVRAHTYNSRASERRRVRVRVMDALIRIRMTDRFFSPRSLNRLTILALRRHARRECRYLAITVPRPSQRASKRSNVEWGLKNVYRAWNERGKLERTSTSICAWPRVKNTSRRTWSTFKFIELNNRDCFECLDEWLMLSGTKNNGGKQFILLSRFIEINIWTSLVFEVSELMESR